MFIKTIGDRYRQLDSVTYAGVINDNGTWKLWAGTSSTVSDPDKIASYADEASARDALADLLSMLGVVSVPGDPV